MDNTLLADAEDPMVVYAHVLNGFFKKVTCLVGPGVGPHYDLQSKYRMVVPADLYISALATHTEEVDFAHQSVVISAPAS